MEWLGFTSTDLEDGLRIGEFSFQEIADIFPCASDVLTKFKTEHPISRFSPHGYQFWDS